MPTNYPTSLDNLTNPVSNDSLNSPSHSAQHANANDAIEAIETKLGFGSNVMPYGFSSGIESAVFSASTAAATITVNFPAGRFTVAPSIFATVNTSSGSLIGSTIRIGTVSATSCTILVTAASAITATVPILWSAIQMTTSAYVAGTAQ